MDDDWYVAERLHFAARDGDLARVEQLIDSGCDVNAVDYGMNYTPLHYAVTQGHLPVVAYLLAKGADVNAHDDETIGETPFGAAAASCSLDMAKLLVDAGANPIIPGWMGLTALDRAKDRKKPEGQRVHGLLLEIAKRKFRYRP